MIEELNFILNNMNCDELRKVASNLKLDRNGRKLELMERIIEFYNQPDFVINTYNELNDYEKEYIDTIVKQRYNPLEKSLNEFTQKYKYSGQFLKKVNYFFIGKKIPKFIREVLDEIVPPYEISYTKTKDTINLTDHYGNIEIEDESVFYFDEFIKYVNEFKIKLSDKKKEILKKDCLRFIGIFNIQEINKRVDEDFKTTDDTVIMKGLIDLLVSAKVINNTKDVITLGSNYKNYLRLNKIEKIQLLLDSYIDSDEINEIERMRSGVYKYNFKNFYPIRNFLVEAIKKLPIDEWVDINEFREQIRMKNGNFIRNALGTVLKKSDYDNWYYGCSYDEFDYPLIDVCLMQYFATLGIIDVVIDSEYDDYGYREYLVNSYVKLTNFGAQVLGLAEYTNELIINNIPLKIVDDKIMVFDDMSNMEHILFFDCFLTKEKDNDYIVYNLNFKGIAKALDLGITLDEIFNYLKDNTSNIPSKIVDDFNYYKSILNKVKIKEVTILEYPKEFASIIKDIKKVQSASCKTDEILVINKKEQKEVKKALESKKIFCNIENK